MFDGDAIEMGLHGDAVAGGLSARQREILCNVAKGVNPYHGCASLPEVQGVSKCLRTLYRRGVITWDELRPGMAAELTEVGIIAHARVLARPAWTRDARARR